MGTTKLQIVFNQKRMSDLAILKKSRKVPTNPSAAGYISDDVFAKMLLEEKMDELLTKSKE